MSFVSSRGFDGLLIDRWVCSPSWSTSLILQPPVQCQSLSVTSGSTDL